MARRDLDDEDDRPLKTKRRGIPTWAIIVAVAVPMVLLCGVIAITILFAFSGRKVVAVQTTTDGPQVDAVQKIDLMSRRDFENLVRRKTPANVELAVGKPNRTTKSGKTQRWYYEHKTYDDITGKPDAVAVVEFDGWNEATHFEY